MKLFSTLIPSLLLGGSLTLLSAAEFPKTIIDTDFSQADANGAPTLLSPPVDDAGLPMRSLTGLSVNPTTTVTLGKEVQGELNPPYLQINLGPRPEDGAAGWWGGGWDLRNLHLASGSYELSFEVTPLAQNLDGGILRIGLQGEAGEALVVEPPMHPTTWPLQIFFSGQGALMGGGAAVNYAEGSTHKVKMAFDLDRKVWSLTVDEAPLFEDDPFPDALANASYVLEVADVSMSGSSKPDGSYALSKVRFVQTAAAAQTKEVPNRIRVACVGDSITAGSGYPDFLRGLLGKDYLVKNYGDSGSTLLTQGDKSYRAQPTFEAAIKFQPQIVVIKLGTNDSKPQNWKFKSAFKDDVRSLIKEFQNLPSKPAIYLALPAPAYSAAFGISETNLVEERPMILEVAKELKIPVIDTFTALSGHPDWFPDGIHPSRETGGKQIAESVAAAIKPDAK